IWSSPPASPSRTMKLKAPYGLLRSAMAGSSRVGVGRPLADTEDDELRRIGRRHADQADQPAVVEVVLRHRGAVAAYEERLLRLGAHQRAGAPCRDEEVLDGLADRAPEPLVVRLEDGPLGRLVDRVLEI